MNVIIWFGHDCSGNRKRSGLSDLTVWEGYFGNRKRSDMVVVLV